MIPFRSFRLLLLFMLPLVLQLCGLITSVDTAAGVKMKEDLDGQAWFTYPSYNVTLLLLNESIAKYTSSVYNVTANEDVIFVWAVNGVGADMMNKCTIVGCFVNTAETIDGFLESRHSFFNISGDLLSITKITELNITCTVKIGQDNTAFFEDTLYVQGPPGPANITCLNSSAEISCTFGPPKLMFMQEIMVWLHVTIQNCSTGNVAYHTIVAYGDNYDFNHEVAQDEFYCLSVFIVVQGNSVHGAATLNGTIVQQILHIIAVEQTQIPSTSIPCGPSSPLSETQSMLTPTSMINDSHSEEGSTQQTRMNKTLIGGVVGGILFVIIIVVSSSAIVFWKFKQYYDKKKKKSDAQSV